jgi:hypothetical protein
MQILLLLCHAHLEGGDATLALGCLARLGGAPAGASEDCEVPPLLVRAHCMAGNTQQVRRHVGGHCGGAERPSASGTGPPAGHITQLLAGN